MYVLNNQSLDRKILETDPNLYLTSYEIDLYRPIFHGKKCVNYTIFPMKYLFRRMSYVQIRGGVRASVLSYQRPPKHLVHQFRYNIAGEMHFYQENTEKNLLRSHHSTQNHQSNGCTAENFNSCIPCFTVLIPRNKLDLVHLKSHVKCISDIE